MAWVVLVAAGILEIGWAVTLPETRSFTAPAPTTLFVVFLAGSMVLLALAARTIPIGTAYAVWVGIGAVGTILYGIMFRDEQASPGQLLALAALVASIVAVKLTAAH